MCAALPITSAGRFWPWGPLGMDLVWALATQWQRAMAEQDYTGEIFRKAHELTHTHGRTACAYAAKVAEESLAKGDMEEHAFWKAVWEALRPRD
jgi:hypothetical protein